MIQSALLDAVKAKIKTIPDIDSKPVFSAYVVDADNELTSMLDGKKFPGCAIMLDISDEDNAPPKAPEIEIIIAVMIFTSTRLAAILRAIKVINAVDKLYIEPDNSYTFQPKSQLIFKSGPKTLYATNEEYGVRVDFKITAEII